MQKAAASVSGLQSAFLLPLYNLRQRLPLEDWASEPLEAMLRAKLAQ